MAARGFGTKTLSGAAQPAFGTTLAGAAVLTPDRYTGMTDPRSQPSSTTVAVTDVTFFRVGDRVIVGPSAGPWDGAKVTAINGSNVTLSGLVRAHAQNEFIILAVAAAVIRIRPGAANTGTTYVGEDATVASNSTTLIDYFTPSTGPYFLGQSASGNVFETQHLWLLGTAADTFLPSITTI